MANANDWDQRLAVAKSNYEKLKAIVDSHNLKTRSIRQLALTAREIQDEVEEAQYQEKKAEQEASTLDREFIEKRQGFPDPFRPSKIYTIQDFTLYFLITSYILFFIGLIMTVSKKMWAFISGIVIFLVGIVVLYKYA